MVGKNTGPKVTTIDTGSTAHMFTVHISAHLAMFFEVVIGPAGSRNGLGPVQPGAECKHSICTS